VFRYLQTPEASEVLQYNIGELQTAADLIARNFEPFQNTGTIFTEFYPAWYRHAADTARNWLSDRLNDITNRYTQEIDAGTAPPNAEQIQQMVQQLRDQMHFIKSPFDP
jgi:hypothetical protein